MGASLFTLFTMLFTLSAHAQTVQPMQCTGGDGVVGASYFDFKSFINQLPNKFVSASCPVTFPHDPKFEPVPDVSLGDTCSSRYPEAPLYCANLEKATQDRTGTQFGHEDFKALCPTTGAPLHISDDEMIRGRAQNLRYAAKSFYAFTGDKNNQLQCCGNDLSCRALFANVKLNIILGLGDHDMTANTTVYVSSPKVAINISLPMLASCKTKDCIDGIIDHELGHACHRFASKSMRASCSDAYRTECHLKKFDETIADLKKTIGDEGAKCVQDGLHAVHDDIYDQYLKGKTHGDEQEARRLATGFNIDEWADEVYADSMFMDQWGTAALAYNCVNSITSDSLHSASVAFMGCMLTYHPKLKARFCGVTKTPK